MANEVRINVTSRDRSAAGFQSARKNAEGLGNSTKRIGEIAAGVLASQVFQRIASAAKDAFVSTIQAASNLNESLNAVNVVFGSAADGVLAIGENSAQSMGLSQRAFNEAAVRFSAFATTIAGEGGNVSQVVEDVTGRASDFASVMNIDVAEAMGLFQSGLAGESEPLRRYGIDISAAAVNTFAWANGIAEAGRELTEQEKVQARYGLIMEQTSDTQGDFANTSDDFANAQRILGAEIENLQASMGQNLLPVLGDLAGLLSDVVTGFGQLPGPIQATLGIIASLIPVAGSAAAAMRLLGISAQALKTALPFIGIALAVGGAVLTGLGLLGSQSKQAATDVDALGAAIRASNLGDIASDLEQRGVLEKVEALGFNARDVTRAFAEGGPTYDDFRKKIQAIADAGEDVTDWAGTGAQAYTENGDQARELLIILDELELGLISNEEAELRMVAAGGELSGGLEEVEDAAADAEQAIKDLRDELFLTGQEAITLEEKQDALADAIDRAKETSEDDEASKRDQRAALRDVASASHELILEMFDQDAATDDVIATTESARKKFIEAATQMGYTGDEAEDLADDYGLIPSDVLTVVTLRDLATKDIGNIRDRLNAIDGKEARVSIINDIITNNRVNTYFSTFGTQGMGGQNATGGIVGAGRGMQDGGISGATNRVLVGEQRPEVVELPVGSRVIPSVDQAMDRGQGGGGGGTMTLILESGGSRLDDLLLEVLRNSIRVKGGTVQTVLGSG